MLHRDTQKVLLAQPHAVWGNSKYGRGARGVGVANLRLLTAQTVSVRVSFMAIERGMPTSSRLKLGSAVIVEIPVKLTFLPRRFPRTRPLLPFNREKIDWVIGLVFFWGNA